MSKTVRNILIGVGVLFVLGAVASAGGNDATSESPSTPTTRKPTTTTTVKAAPQISDFSIDLLINSNQCFGSAGGLLEVETSVSYSGGDPGSGRLVYQINGGEDGPEIGSIEFSGRGYRGNTHIISTATCGATPTVQITELRTR